MKTALLFLVSLVTLGLASSHEAKVYAPNFGYGDLNNLQHHAQDSLGQYDYGYSNSLSSKSEIKTADGVVRGTYSYVDANNIVQTVNYLSDDLGFRVQATNLPGRELSPPVIPYYAPQPVVQAVAQPVEQKIEQVEAVPAIVEQEPVQYVNQDQLISHDHLIQYVQAAPAQVQPVQYQVQPQQDLIQPIQTYPGPVQYAVQAPIIQPQQYQPIQYQAPLVQDVQPQEYQEQPSETHQDLVQATPYVQVPVDQPTQQLHPIQTYPGPVQYQAESDQDLVQATPYVQAPTLIQTQQYQAAPIQNYPTSVQYASQSPIVQPLDYVQAPVYQLSQTLPLDPYNYAPLPSPQLITKYHSQDEFGQYQFGYNDGNTVRDEIRDVNGFVQGVYTYTDENGVPQRVSYLAGPNGFQVLDSTHTYSLPVPVQDEPEVALAKAAHLKAFKEIQEAHLKQSSALVDSEAESEETANEPIVIPTTPELDAYVSPPDQVNQQRIADQPENLQNQIVAVPANYAPAYEYDAIPVHATQFHAQNELGEYNYGYSNPTSSKQELKSANGIVQGSYSYIDAHGLLQTVNYISDEGGFRVSATNLPQSPQEEPSFDVRGDELQ